MQKFRPRAPPFLFALTVALVLPAFRSSFMVQHRMDDAEILSHLSRVTTMEAECTAYAIEHATLPAIRALAGRLRDENGAFHAQGELLAEQLGLLLDHGIRSAVADDHAAVMADLYVMIGANFDRSFIDHEIAFLQLALRRVEKEMLPAATHPEVKALLERTRAGLRSYLELARVARKQLPMITA